MFLKRIELSGFKSFADKTELEFVSGITAVVGPNGSGKSNISDAIRWVLGEQSAKSLRGGKMEDVIFAGSVSRKPVNYSEVSLTLENSDNALPLDFAEVTVTRRINRNGDSEYFINKQPCRLKDITELFMDTGIGKEAYSIIGQGRIEEILSTRSEDRRAIFEEASGIVKYKSRKKEAQKRLDETEANLLRIHDLISELEVQIEPLREQAEKANTYKELREELKAREISLYVHQIEELHRTWKETGDKLQELQDRQAALAAVVGAHDADLEQHRMEARRLENELEQLQTSLLRLSEEAEKCEGFGEVLKERRKNLEGNIKALGQAAETQSLRKAAQEAELAQANEQLQLALGELAQIAQALQAEEAQLAGVHEEAGTEREEQLKAELFEILSKIAQTRNEIRYCEQQMETSARRKAKSAEERQRIELELKELAATMRTQEERIAEAARTIEAVREQFLAKSKLVKEKEKLLEEAQFTARKWEQKIGALTSRRDTLVEMQHDFEGYAHGVREILKSREKQNGLRGIHGAVAELVKVPETVEAAMETALGGALQHIVMSDEASARAAIAYLKERQLGRATFLPLDVIQERTISAGERNACAAIPGFVGVAVELVAFRQEYTPIFRNLLGNVLVADNLEHANRIAAACKYRYRVVTLDGDVVHAGGSMTGGSRQKKSASLLGRQRLIEQLTEEIASAHKQLTELKQKSDQVKKEIGEMMGQLDDLRRAGEDQRLKEQHLRAELGRYEAEYNLKEKQIHVSSEEEKLLQNEQLSFTGKITELQASLKELEAQERTLQAAILEAETVRKRNESAKEALQSRLTELKVQKAAKESALQAVKDNIARLRRGLEDTAREIAESGRALAQYEADLKMNSEEMVKQTERLNELVLQKQECTDAIDFKRAERAEWLKKLELEESKTKEERIQLRQVEEAMHQTEVRVNRLDVELDNLLAKLSEEYELSYELARQKFPPPEDISGTQNAVRELKKQIAQLGEVNLGAIDEYARVSERFRFLSEQRQDLIEAKTTLYQVINEIDGEMSKRFWETFEAIRSHFIVVFSKLFGGGRADLLLTEPENLLETGIEIVAQPPGKKLQTLSLLSGGERAFTAIALLFAILQVKPVPFCVLDEVEAALDDANVTRFAQYLREYSADTQFIVVTHRKGTMEEADVLYGVTMEDDGISKLVSVRLEDGEPISA
ncbi:MAG TPA: chromosome segregation protein SMC [Bacilli bacterium]